MWSFGASGVPASIDGSFEEVNAWVGARRVDVIVFVVIAHGAKVSDLDVVEFEVTCKA